MKNVFEFSVLKKKRGVADPDRPNLIRQTTAFNCDCSDRVHQASAKIGESKIQYGNLTKSKSMSITSVCSKLEAGDQMRCMEICGFVICFFFLLKSRAIAVSNAWIEMCLVVMIYSRN